VPYSDYRLAGRIGPKRKRRAVSKRILGEGGIQVNWSAARKSLTVSWVTAVTHVDPSC